MPASMVLLPFLRAVETNAVRNRRMSPSFQPKIEPMTNFCQAISSNGWPANAPLLWRRTAGKKPIARVEAT